MSSKSRGKDGARRREKQRRREKRRGKSGAGVERGGEGARGERPDFEVPRPDLCQAPIHVTRGLGVVDDPLDLLGLTPEQAADPERVRAAFRAELSAHPPEREPDLARRLREARDRLLDPDLEFERKFARLYLPDPRAFGLPEVEQPTGGSPAVEPNHLPARSRLLGQLVLYALLEEEIEGGSEPGTLPFD
jgi:hypothetical protein